MKKILFVIALTVFVLSACGTPATPPPVPTNTPVPLPTETPIPPTATATAITEFPIGLFDCVECAGFTERYSDDGTLVVYFRGNIEYLTGKWYVKGDIFYTGDSYCNDEDTMPASYKWHFDGEILTFQVIEDECSDRKGSLDGKPWRLIEEKQEKEK